MSQARKRVSFGGHRSTIETLIVDDMDFDTIPVEEKNFYQQNLILSQQQSASADNLRINRQSGLPKSRAAETSVENPFQAGGELRRKADYILTHSRISRADLHIVDPDMMPKRDDAHDNLRLQITPTPDQPADLPNPTYNSSKNALKEITKTETDTSEHKNSPQGNSSVENNVQNDFPYRKRNSMENLSKTFEMQSISKDIQGVKVPLGSEVASRAGEEQCNVSVCVAPQRVKKPDKNGTVDNNTPSNPELTVAQVKVEISPECQRVEPIKLDKTGKCRGCCVLQ